MKKRDRLHLRLSVVDGALVRAAAQRLDTSISEFVRDAVVAVARDVMRKSPQKSAESVE